MEKIVEKRNYLILLVIMILILFMVFNLNKPKESVKSFYYFDETITIKLYPSNNKIINDIDKIYEEYKYNKEEIVQNISKQSDNVLGANDVQNIIGSYASEKVQKYFNKNNIKNYIINENGNIIAGTPYKKNYSISLYNKNKELIDIVYLKNQALATCTNDNKTVVVIGNKLSKVKIICLVLNKLSLEEGLKYIEKYKAEALWQIDGKITTTKNFTKYMKNL